MIAIAKPVRPTKKPVPAWHAGFLAMLPAIRRYACIAFRNLDDDAREDAIAEVIANALVAYVRLFDQGRSELAYATPLVRYAVAQFHDGRRVGNRINTRDVMTESAKKRRSITIESLDRFDKHAGEWIEATIEDDKTPVPDQAAFRCDFPIWLTTLSRRNRQISEELAKGHSTSHVARRFKVSAGRVSQLRRELHDSWHAFHGDSVDPHESSS